MKKYLTKMLSVFAALVFTASAFISCKDPNGGGELPSPITISVSETTSETIEFDLEYTESIDSYIKFEIKVINDENRCIFSRNIVNKTKDHIVAYPLNPNREYKIEITAFDEFAHTLAEESVQATTKELTIPELLIIYSDESYTPSFQIDWDETGYSFAKQEIYVFTDEDIPEGKTAADYDIEGKSPALTRESDSYPSVYEYFDVEKMQDSAFPIKDKAKHYFKLVCYSDDDAVFGSKVFECFSGVRVPPYLHEDDIEVKKGTHSIKVSLDLSDYRKEYFFEKVRFEIKDSDYSSAEDLIEPYTVDISDNTNDIVTVTVPDFAYDGYCYLHTYLINEAGEKKCEKVYFNKNIFPVTMNKDDAVYTLSQTSVSLQVPVSYDYLEEDTTMTYTIRESSSATSKVSYGYENEPASDSVVLTDLAPEKQIYIRYVHADVSWTDKNGEIQKAQYHMYANFLTYTYGFDAPANFKVSGDPKTTELSFTFDELTEEQKFGKDIKYILEVYNKSGTKVTSKFVTPEDAKISGLKKGTEYTFKLYATTADSISKDKTYTPAVLIANTSSGLSKPIIKATNNSANSDPLLADITIDWDKISQDTGNNIVYGIEYKIFKGHNFTTTDETFSGEAEYSNTITVNGGNRYFVRVSAYDKAEPTAISYSDEEEIQLPAIDDTKLYGALIYTNNLVGPEGSVVDLANNKMWENYAEIRSVQGMYNFGVVSFLAGEYVDPLKYGLPTGETTFNSVKMSYEKALDSSNPRVIFMDRMKIVGPSNFATFKELYIVKPDALGGEIIKEFKTIKKADGSYDFLSDQVNMPFFGTRGSSDSPSEAGLEIDETWVFNNSIYIGVVQETQGYLGFSYYY